MKRALLILFLWVVPAFGLEEFYSVTKSVRALGMGGAFYGMSDDQYALFYNPAGLSFYRKDSEMMLNLQAQLSPSTLSAIRTLSQSGQSISSITTTVAPYAGNPLYGGVGIMPYYVRKNFGVGVLIADAKGDFALLGKELDSLVDVTAISDTALVLGYGREAAPNLHIGANIKGMLRMGGRRVFTVLDIAQSNAFTLDPRTLGGIGFGVDADIGAMYELKDLPFGLINRVSLSLNNILATKFTLARQGGAPPGLPRMLSLSYYTVLPGVSIIDNFHLVADLSEFQVGGDNSDPDLGGRRGSLFKHVNLGVEMPMGNFAVRAGIRQGYPTFGIGVNLSMLRLDAAYYAEEVSNQPGRLPSHRFAFNIAIGNGSAPAPAITSDVWEVPKSDDEKPVIERIEVPAKDPVQSDKNESKPVDTKSDE